MKLNDTCRKCITDKYLDAYPENADAASAAKYREKVLDLVKKDNGLTSPEIVESIMKTYRSLFGQEKDYSAEKSFFNRLMLGFEERMRRGVESSDDPLLAAIKYSMAANYIDFEVLKDVDENELFSMLEKAKEIPLDKSVYEALKRDIISARRLVYFTDNCGEIVADKLVINEAKRINPGLEVKVIVRGEKIVNDATLDDAAEVGMDKLACVIPSGSGVGGIVLPRISKKAREAAENADVLISKGQANYETLGGCGLNVYYLFLCKCDRFLSEFCVPRFTGLIVKEKND